MQEQELKADVALALDLPEAQAQHIVLEPCNPGGNNRVYSAIVEGRRVLAKWYFRDSRDTRDRLKAEYTFLNCLATAGIRCVPTPIASNPERGIGIYQHIEGRRLVASEIDTSHIDEAAQFFLQLNHPKTHEIARELMNASEACFSIEEHFSMVDGRIKRLVSIPGTLNVDTQAREFIKELHESWRSLKSRILHKLRRVSQEILPVRCISPSDFGFHNALQTSRGICFLDFEYAGWDDPAKMAGDFFSHPAVPVDIKHFERFLDTTMRYSKDSRALADQARLLFPVFQTKWCCIILNDFLPAAAQRRRFADATFDEVSRKTAQLEKAQQLFSLLNESLRTGRVGETART